VKLSGKSDKSKAPAEASSASPPVAAQSNAAAQQDAGLGEPKKGNFLSRAWNGVKEAGSDALDAVKGAGSALKNAGSEALGSAKNGAVVGAGVGALPGLAVGGAIGGGIGAAGGKESAAKGAAVGGGLLALPGALVGGVLGAVGGVAQRGIDELRADEKGLLAETAEIPAYHVILEQLAHTYAYGRGDVKTLEGWGYEIASEHEDPSSGFRVVGFKPMAPGATDPDGNPLRPVTAFRGTANGGGAMDDANQEGIGTFQFSRNEKEIEGVIKASTGPGAPDVTGHSLGGALAQLAAARFGSLVGDIVTFQSPGINGAEAQRIDKDEHEATHYRTGGDMVSDAGEAFAIGKVFRFDHKGPDSPMSHMTFPLAELNALRAKHNMDVPIVDGARSSDDHFVKDEGGGHHEGHWEKDEVQTKSRLLDVNEFGDAQEAPTTGITRLGGALLGGGRKMAETTRAAAGAISGIADRQGNYAAAWRAIRAVCRTVTRPDEVPGVRGQVVDLCIKHGVRVEDHAKFISQAEAAMLDALEASPLNATPADAAPAV
jgi:pimeloyl-ACP methyl ester carboxylesterase